MNAAMHKQLNDELRAEFVGRKIVDARYLDDSEAEGLGWDEKCPVLFLDNGLMVFPSSDDEGNNAGVLFTSGKKELTFGVIR